MIVREKILKLGPFIRTEAEAFGTSISLENAVLARNGREPFCLHRQIMPSVTYDLGLVRLKSKVVRSAFSLALRRERRLRFPHRRQGPHFP